MKYRALENCQLCHSSFMCSVHVSVVVYYPTSSTVIPPSPLSPPGPRCPHPTRQEPGRPGHEGRAVSDQTPVHMCEGGAVESGTETVH